MSDLKAKFLASYSKRLKAFYRQKVEGLTPSKKEGYQLEGYMMAALDMGVVGRKELTQTIEQVHFEVFGHSMAERHEAEQRKGGLQRDSDAYEGLDSPTWIRRNISPQLFEE